MKREIVFISHFQQHEQQAQKSYVTFYEKVVEPQNSFPKKFFEKNENQQHAQFSRKCFP